MIHDDESLCDQLDEYLAGDLPAERRSEFDNHISECESCGQAAADWHTMQNVLQRATRELEAPSGSLLERIALDRAAPAREQRRRNVAWRAAIAGTCAALLAAIWIVAFAWKQPDRNEIVQQTLVLPKSITLSPALDVKLPDDVIGIPIDIDEPNVTVVWIYPATSSETKPL